MLNIVQRSLEDLGSIFLLMHGNRFMKILVDKTPMIFIFFSIKKKL
jgi:hypothetical protein